MKKEYSKPQIMFESFTLSTNIAAGCDVKTDTPSARQCGYGEDIFGVSIFVDGITDCEAKYPDGHDGLCYHVPTETTNLFNS